MRLSEKLAEKPEIGIAEDLFEVCRLVELDDFDLAHKANKQVRRESVAIGRKERSFRALDLNKKSLLFDAPHEFDSYMLFSGIRQGTEQEVLRSPSQDIIASCGRFTTFTGEKT